MKFSIITPSYNHAHFIEQTILSVMRQKGCDIEHIIMDGGSKDGTLEILRKYDHLNWVSEKDKGQSDAINKGFLKASGDILAWLNSDDYYYEDTLGHVADYFRDHPDCFFLYGNLAVVEEDGTFVNLASGPGMSHKALLKNPDTVRQPCCFWRREVMEQIGLPDPDLHLVMDLEYFLRISAKFKLHYLDKDICHYRLHENCKSLQFGERQLEEIKLVYKRFGLDPEKRLASLLKNREKQGVKQTLLRYLKILKLR